MSDETPALFTKSFSLITASTFFISWALHVIMPLFPIFLLEQLQVNGTISGIILALFPLGALLCRPLAGWLADSFPKRKTALLSIFLLLVASSGYFFFTHPLALALCRLLQGFFFSIASTTLSVIVLEIIPEKRMGTGIGIFSSNYSLAMILGPMAGFFVFNMFPEDVSMGYQAVFMLMVFSCACSLVALLLLRKRANPLVNKKPFSQSDLILKSGLSVSFCLICLVVLYGITLNYVALFAKNIGLEHVSSYFFLIMGIGLVLSRVISGYFYDKGYVFLLVVCANICLIVSMVLFIHVASVSMFLTLSLILGFCHGAITPTFQTLLVQFAKTHERGLASSTYFISFDTGMMLALFGGGVIIDMFSLQAAFYVGTALQVLCILVFIMFVMPAYKRLKL